MRTFRQDELELELAQAQSAFSTEEAKLVAHLGRVGPVMLIALGLAFIPYLRNPTRRLMPSLVICAVLLADASWLVGRTLPSKAENHDFVLSVETRVCRNAFGCSPPADLDGLVAECIQKKMGDLTGVVGLLAGGYVDQKAWEKCQSLVCDDFANCFDREAGLLAMPPDEDRRVLRLVCEAIQQEQTSSKWTEMERALKELQNPALAGALLEEGRQTCRVTNGTEPRTGNRVRK